MRVPPSLLLALLGTACTIEPNDSAGAPCQTSSDCGDDPAYRCLADPDGARRCFAVFPPENERDAGPPPTPDAGPVFWCSDVEAILARYCAGCHVPDGGSGQVDFRLDIYETSGTVLGAKDKADRIKERMVRFKTMPPPEALLFPSDLERARVGAWVDQGAPFCADGGSP